MSTSFSSKLTDIDDRREPPSNTDESRNRRNRRQPRLSAAHTGIAYVSSNGDASSTSDFEHDFNDNAQTRFSPRRRNAVVAANFTSLTAFGDGTGAEEPGVSIKGEIRGIWRVLTSIMAGLGFIHTG